MKKEIENYINTMKRIEELKKKIKKMEDKSKEGIRKEFEKKILQNKKKYGIISCELKKIEIRQTVYCNSPEKELEIDFIVQIIFENEKKCMGFEGIELEEICFKNNKREINKLMKYYGARDWRWSDDKIIYESKDKGEEK